jgi:hypothetical protein
MPGEPVYARDIGAPPMRAAWFGLCRPETSLSPPSTSPVPTQLIDGLPVPATYQQACNLEPSVCDAGLPNALVPLPPALRRPLSLPQFA